MESKHQILSDSSDDDESRQSKKAKIGNPIPDSFDKDLITRILNESKECLSAQGRRKFFRKGFAIRRRWLDAMKEIEETEDQVFCIYSPLDKSAIVTWNCTPETEEIETWVEDIHLKTSYISAVEAGMLDESSAILSVGSKLGIPFSTTKRIHLSKIKTLSKLKCATRQQIADLASPKEIAEFFVEESIVHKCRECGKLYACLCKSIQWSSICNNGPNQLSLCSTCSK